jgi:hypothetical protein
MGSPRPAVWNGAPTRSEYPLAICSMLTTRNCSNDFARWAWILTAGHELASALGYHTSNKPLFGWVKHHRDDPKIQKELDIALAHHAREENEKGVQLSLWTGANPHAVVPNLRYPGLTDDDGRHRHRMKKPLTPLFVVGVEHRREHPKSGLPEEFPVTISYLENERDPRTLHPQYFSALSVVNIGCQQRQWPTEMAFIDPEKVLPLSECGILSLKNLSGLRWLPLGICQLPVLSTTPW